MGQNRDAMEQVMLEASKVDSMTASPGWSIIREYCERTIKHSHDTWLYADEDNKTVKELKATARTCHAIITLVENFKEEGKRLWNLWARAEGLIPEVAMDMDNKSPNIEENF